MKTMENITFTATYFGNLPLIYTNCNSALNNCGFPMHMHRHYEFIHVYNGSMQIITSDKTFNLQKGDIIFFDSCEAHYGITSDKEIGYDVVQIKKEFLESFQKENV